MGIYGKGTFYGNDKPNAQYYEDQGDGFACQDIGETTNERGCSENSLNVDLSSNLTKAQLYSAQQIEFFNKGKGGEALERTKSPNTPDSFARFSVNRKPLDWTDGILYQNTNKQQPERNYFGPVKLVKFGVKLLNDRGFEVNLHDHDWSFSIIVKQLYQY